MFWELHQIYMNFTKFTLPSKISTHEKMNFTKFSSTWILGLGGIKFGSQDPTQPETMAAEYLSFIAVNNVYVSDVALNLCSFCSDT